VNDVLTHKNIVALVKCPETLATLEQRLLEIQKYYYKSISCRIICYSTRA